ncbi:hypothetical protein [Flaviaesturariibacter terrae]
MVSSLFTIKVVRPIPGAANQWLQRLDAMLRPDFLRRTAWDGVLLKGPGHRYEFWKPNPAQEGSARVWPYTMVEVSVADNGSESRIELQVRSNLLLRLLPFAGLAGLLVNFLVLEQPADIHYWALPAILFLAPLFTYGSRRALLREFEVLMES